MANIRRHRLKAGAQKTMKAALWQHLHDREQPMRNRCKCGVADIASISLNSLWRATVLVLFASAATAQVPSAADTPVAWPQSFSITGPKDYSVG
jgi:hypothetical protein